MQTSSGLSDTVPGVPMQPVTGIVPGVPGNTGNNSGTPAIPPQTNPAEGAQQFCLRWNSYPATVATQLATLRQAEDFVDVTLACDGRQLRAHKLVLSACSPYFMQLFKSTPCQHPVIFLRDVGFRQLVALLEFMYAGEVNVSQIELPALLRTAEALQVRGLADTTANNNCQTQQKPAFSPHYPQTAGQPVIPNQQQPTAPVPMDPTSGALPSVDGTPTTQSVPSNPTSTPSNPPTAKRSRRENSISAKVEDENSSDSNDSHEEFAVGDQDVKHYITDADLTEQLDDTGEVFGGVDDPVDALDISEADFGNDTGVPSPEESSDEEVDDDDDDDDDGECKEFTYQSDASYSQEGMADPGGTNSNGESVPGPSGTGTGGTGESGGAGNSKDEPGQAPSGSGRNRLSRSLWPPGIPYHGPQQCPYCPRVLSNVGNWRKHVLTMHFAREKVYKCKHCASAFRTAEYLQKHYVRVHNYPQKMTRRKYVEQT